MILNNIFILSDIIFHYKKLFCRPEIGLSSQAPSRPLTPVEQIDIMMNIENEKSKGSHEPTQRDLEVNLENIVLPGLLKL